MSVEAITNAISNSGLTDVILRVKVDEVGPAGPDPYQYWLSKGNTGTEEDFFRAWSANARARYAIHELPPARFLKKEFPTEIEASNAAINANAEPGDYLCYETVGSINNETIGKVVYKWQVTENGIILLPMSIPIYTRRLLANETYVGSRYKYDNGSGLYPTEYLVNKAGTPVELYVNPSVDYELLVQTIQEQLQILNT